MAVSKCQRPVIKNPRPTRAETTDVANAIYDGTSAIMLSGETAVGKYPVLTLQTMCQIAEKTESDINYKKRFKDYEVGETTKVADAISHATVTTAHDLEAAAIVTVTKTGTTATMISKYRPACPIISCTTSEKVQRQLFMSWGVAPVLIEEKSNTDELFDYAVEKSMETGLIKHGDIVAITSGVPLGVPGTTNILKVHVVGHILVSGLGITKKGVVGKLCVCEDFEDVRNKFEDGDILVIRETSNEIMDILRKASGIITEKEGFSSHAAVVGLSLDIPVICGASYSTKILKTGTIVTMDATRGLVYNGVMSKL
ncbi:MAG: pyruvate kinase [archaeon]